MSLKGIFPIDKWEYNSHAIVDCLSAEEYKLLMKGARKDRYQKREIIFREGAKPIGIFLIHSGKVKKYKIDNIGKEHIFYVANAGELIGYHALLANEPYPDSAAALEDCELMFIPAANFLSVFNKSAELSKQLLKTLSHEFSVYINNLAVFAQRPVRERIAIVFIILREKFKNTSEEGKPVVISISRDDIANMSGTTRENVTRMITEFKNEGILETKGRKIIILDIKKLVEISNYS